MTTGISAAYQLSGLALKDGWVVLNVVERPPDHSGGAFSVSYLARHSTGSMGFLKAFDYAAALEDDDPARALAELTSTYNAERDLLAQCGDRKLGRVVRVLAAATVRVPDTAPGAVSYLIFELADGDVRDVLAVADPADQLPMLRLAHHAAVAMSQLHSIGVTHQDVKPSNLLVWRATSAPDGKLADLGRAHMEGRPAPHDGLVVPGDCSYAAPELLYGDPERLPSYTRRYAADLYMLGNLLCFLLTKVSYNALLFGHLDDSQHWKTYSGTFDEVLPGLIDAHGLALRRVRGALRDALSDDVVQLIDELCFPDPRLRGDPVARGRGQLPYRLERFVTRLDRLHRKAAIAMRVSA